MSNAKRANPNYKRPAPPAVQMPADAVAYVVVERPVFLIPAGWKPRELEEVRIDIEDDDNVIDGDTVADTAD